MHWTPGLMDSYPNSADDLVFGMSASVDADTPMHDSETGMAGHMSRSDLSKLH